MDDGQWHTAKVSRYGSAAILTLDGGEGRRYNDTFVFQGHQVSDSDIVLDHSRRRQEDEKCCSIKKSKVYL